MTRLLTKLIKLDACDEGIEWATTQKGSFQKSWNDCKRGDWMLWLLTRSKEDHKKIVLASYEILKTVLKYIPKDQNEILKKFTTSRNSIKNKKQYSNENNVPMHINDLNFDFDSFINIEAYEAVISFCNMKLYARPTTAVSGDVAHFTAHTHAHVATSTFYDLFVYHASVKKSLLNSAKIIRKFFPKPPRF